jgi:hypothetical protein
MHATLQTLLKKGPRVVNVGVEDFAHDLKVQEVPVIQMDWRPPQASGDLLAKLRKLKKQ